jgi:hypothetical protein
MFTPLTSFPRYQITENNTIRGAVRLPMLTGIQKDLAASQRAALNQSVMLLIRPSSGLYAGVMFAARMAAEF